MFSTCLSLDYLLLIYTIFFLFVGIRISPWFFDRLSHFWRYSIVCSSCLCTIHGCSKFQVSHLFFPLDLQRTFSRYASFRKVVSLVAGRSSSEAKKSLEETGKGHGERGTLTQGKNNPGLGESSRHQPEVQRPFFLLTCFGATKFVFLSVFTLIKMICLIIRVKPLPSVKSGWRASPKNVFS